MIRWFTVNDVAANLLMLLIILAGLYTLPSIPMEILPKYEADIINIRIANPGATPEEMERDVVMRVEEAIHDLEGIKEIISTAVEGTSTVDVEVARGYKPRDLMDDIKTRIDAINNFPEEIERPDLKIVQRNHDVISVVVAADMDEADLRRIGEKVRDDLAALKGISQVVLTGVRPYEIAIEVSEQQLQRYGLTFEEIARAINRSSLNVSTGTIKGKGGDILLSSRGQAYNQADFENIVIRSAEHGVRVLLGDIATVSDGFMEGNLASVYQGKTAVMIDITRVGNENAISIATAVKQYITKKQTQLPAGIEITYWRDRSKIIKGRISTLLKSALQGGILVFLLLTIFLRLSVALWVCVGIPVSFLGVLAVMPLLGVTLNVNTVFAFIMVLGIVVDDAIVIGESAYAEIQHYGHSTDNIINGTMRVAMPATFGVLTTIAAFAPLLMIDATFAAFFRAIALVVSFCLMFSLIESKWILPAHLANMKYIHLTEENSNWLERQQIKFKKGLEEFIHHKYKYWLKKALLARYNTMATFIAVLILSVGLLIGGFVKLEVFPSVPSDFIQGNLTMVDGSAVSERNKVIERIQAAAANIAKDNPHQELEFIKHSMVFTNGNTQATFVLELVKPEQRELDAYEIEKLWRDEIGEIPGTKELRFFAGANAGGGAAIEFQLTGKDYIALEAAALDIQEKLSSYEGVYDIRNSFSRGSQEIQLSIKPEAEVLGLALVDLAKQVRQAFYGEEAQRIQRGRDELKVMVRYPKENRISVSDLEDMWIRTSSGDKVPFYQVANISIGQGFSTITRVNQKRSLTISADIDAQKVESRKVISEMNDISIPDILANYPTVKYGVEGASKEQADFLRQLGLAAIGALFLIYGLIAIPTKSYVQPLVIMSVIPFGIIGAIVGHWLLGKTINMMSIYGFIALTGVVVNDSLIMVDFINKAKGAGHRMMDVVIKAGTARFRAILLTSLTTFFGIFPLFFEQSLQAQFIIPMAISLGFGIVFATVITLFLIPALYLIKDDMQKLIQSTSPNYNDSVT